MMERVFFILDDGTKREVRNISPYADTFLVHDEDVINYIDRAVEIEHTHPDGSQYLSTADRVCQIQLGLPWSIGGRTYRPCPPLLGREFIHGQQDCFSIMRDFYMLACGYDLPNFERSDNWWAHGDNLYLDNLSKSGFVQVDNLQLGDVVIMRLGSNTPNHAALVVGDGVILHHLPDRLSKRDLYGRRYQTLTHSVWRFKEWQPSDFMGISEDMEIDSSSM